jgi:hypothetical protein
VLPSDALNGTGHIGGSIGGWTIVDVTWGMGAVWMLLASAPNQISPVTQHVGCGVARISSRRWCGYSIGMAKTKAGGDTKVTYLHISHLKL